MLEQLVALLDQEWPRPAPAAELRKGPRRRRRADRDKGGARHRLVVPGGLESPAEIGVEHPEPAHSTESRQVEMDTAMRADIVEALLAGPTLIQSGQHALFLLRRAAWHVLDHAWEIQDRSDLISRDHWREGRAF